MAGLVPAIHAKQHPQMTKVAMVWRARDVYVGVTNDFVCRIREHREGRRLTPYVGGRDKPGHDSGVVLVLSRPARQ